MPKDVARRTALPPKPDPIDDPEANPKWIATAIKARCEYIASAEVVMMWSGICTEKAEVSQKRGEKFTSAVPIQCCFAMNEVATLVMCFGSVQFVEYCCRDVA